MIDYRSPDQAPPRPDLTFLRRRSRPAAAGGSGQGRAIAPAPAKSLAELIAERSAHAAAEHRRTPPDRPAPHDRSQRQTRTEAHRARVPPARSAAPPPATASSTAASSAAARAAQPSGSASLDLGAPAAPTGGPTSLDLGAPASPAGPSTDSASLDLGRAPTAPPAHPPAGRSGESTSLDLGSPAPVQPPTRSVGSSPLDLSADPAPGPSMAVARAGDARAPKSWPEPRTRSGIPTTLTDQSPTVTLTRLQSGIGALVFEAIVTSAAGELRLGAAYQLRSGSSSTVQHNMDRRFGPPGQSRRPILLAARQQYERLSLDLRQVRELERMVIYALADDGGQVRWSGTLLATTFGGDRIEMPIDLPPVDGIAALASVYQVNGELVLRSEMDLLGRTIREACEGFGFDRITWVDDRTPLD